MLNRGEIDTAFGFLPARPGEMRNFLDVDRYGGTSVEGNRRIRQLFPDGGRGIITAFYKKTGVVPVSHMVIVQERVLSEHPWVALEVYKAKAFQRSKLVAFERAREFGAGYLLFVDDTFREQADIFGSDPYPQGVKANRHMLEILFRNSFEEGLTKKLARVEDVFFRTTLDT